MVFTLPKTHKKKKKKNREKDYSAFFPLTAKYNLIT